MNNCKPISCPHLYCRLKMIVKVMMLGRKKNAKPEENKVRISAEDSDKTELMKLSGINRQLQYISTTVNSCSEARGIN